MVQLYVLPLFLIVAISNSINGQPDENFYTSDEFIELVNLKADTWTAGRNFPQDASADALKKLSGALIETNEEFLLPVVSHASNIRIPKSFDSRYRWPNCPSIPEIRDQGPCGSCWAISSVSVMSDRACIWSKGKQKIHFSTEDLLTCCPYCGSGCLGGLAIRAWLYYVRVGIVSGGKYKSNDGCIPYDLPPCEHHVKGPRNNCSSIHAVTPVCIRKCQQNYPILYKNDQKKGRLAYWVRPDMKNIQKEIMLNGPVVAAFQVYYDFLTYKSGVYQHVAGKLLANHAVRIIGWGVENGVDYWLIANSWNSDWGDKGLFKILRGINHLYIESRIIAGIPAK